MTSPRANWLGRYLEVEKKTVPAINAVLEDAERSIWSTLKSLGDDGFSTGIRRAQLNLSLRNVRRQLKDMFGSVTDIIRDKQGDAAVAAVEAGLFDDRGVMKLLFPKAVDRERYSESLRVTAQRNIQSTMTRVLQTEQPLSGRVWKTNALARGQVSRVVNNALARGDSAINLANEVRDLVRPDTPGGISYAAKRLARTEINNAFHAQSINDMQNKPWLNQVQWNLSKVHASDPGDECEEYAAMKYFPPEQVPEKPHPNCRCFVTAKPMAYDEFEKGLISGQFDDYLDDVMPERWSR